MSADVATLAGSPTTLSDEALEGFEAQLRGSASGEAGREVFNAMHNPQPALTVKPSGAVDVVDAVNFARKQGLVMAIRGGGHSLAGLSTVDGGMLLDLSEMRSVYVDPERRLAHVQGGALWGDVDRETQVFGLAAPGGVVSDTGVAGLTLGGGYGWLRRKYGLSIDCLAEAQVVCADGIIRTASEDSNPDLYWAIRGGGGNFGVITSFTFELQPVGPEVAFSATFYPLEEYAEILRHWRSYVEEAPNEVTSVCVSITFPANPEMPEAVHDRPCVIVGGVHAGDVAEGMEATKPLRELGTVLFDMSGPTPYVGVQTGFDPLFPRNTMSAYWKSQYLDELSDDAIAEIASNAANRPAPLTLVNTFAMGGAIADVDPEETAFATRSAPYMVSIDGMWTDEVSDEDGIAWVRSAWEGVGKHATGDVYLNFTGLGDDEAVSAGVDTAFGRNLQRLAEVKAEYDPTNFFRVNHNIEPAS
ncbi:MAG: FAD-binding oxidoreductase [Solirubrobacterales bacterium]